MGFKLMSTADAARSQGVNVLVYGPPGAGKTRLCATTGPKTLIISCEGGLLSLREHDINSAIITSIADLREAYAYLRKDCPFDWVCLDSISEIAEVCLAERKQANKDPRKAYGELADTMYGLIRGFRDLPVNVYFSAKMNRTADEKTQLVRYHPSMPGKQLADIGYLFDEVFAYRLVRDEDGDIGRWLQTEPDGEYEAKDRSGSLEPWVQPDLSEILHTIIGE